MEHNRKPNSTESTFTKKGITYLVAHYWKPCGWCVIRKNKKVESFPRFFRSPVEMLVAYPSVRLELLEVIAQDQVSIFMDRGAGNKEYDEATTVLDRRHEYENSMSRYAMQNLRPARNMRGGQ